MSLSRVSSSCSSFDSSCYAPRQSASSDGSADVSCEGAVEQPGMFCPTCQRPLVLQHDPNQNPQCRILPRHHWFLLERCSALRKAQRADRRKKKLEKPRPRRSVGVQTSPCDFESREPSPQRFPEAQESTNNGTTALIYAPLDTPLDDDDSTSKSLHPSTPSLLNPNVPPFKSMNPNAKPFYPHAPG